MQTGEILIIITILVLNILMLIALIRIIMKMGYSPYMALLALLPIVNILLPFYFASVKWPIEAKLKEAQEEIKKLKGANSL